MRVDPVPTTPPRTGRGRSRPDRTAGRRGLEPPNAEVATDGTPGLGLRHDYPTATGDCTYGTLGSSWDALDRPTRSHQPAEPAAPDPPAVAGPGSAERAGGSLVGALALTGSSRRRRRRRFGRRSVGVAGPQRHHQPADPGRHAGPRRPGPAPNPTGHRGHGHDKGDCPARLRTARTAVRAPMTARTARPTPPRTRPTRTSSTTLAKPRSAGPGPRDSRRGGPVAPTRGTMDDYSTAAARTGADPHQPGGMRCPAYCPRAALLASAALAARRSEPPRPHPDNDNTLHFVLTCDDGNVWDASFNGGPSAFHLEGDGLYIWKQIAFVTPAGESGVIDTGSRASPALRSSSAPTPVPSSGNAYTVTGFYPPRPRLGARRAGSLRPERSTGHPAIATRLKAATATAVPSRATADRRPCPGRRRRRHARNHDRRPVRPHPGRRGRLGRRDAGPVRPLVRRELRPVVAAAEARVGDAAGRRARPARPRPVRCRRPGRRTTSARSPTTSRPPPTGSACERFVLVGHSLGGAAAISYAADYPQRVAGLVLVATPGPAPRRAGPGRPRLARQGLRRDDDQHLEAAAHERDAGHAPNGRRRERPHARRRSPARSSARRSSSTRCRRSRPTPARG